ncbi:hypothetical protein ABK040_000362 [Willaertia magna]
MEQQEDRKKASSEEETEQQRLTLESKSYLPHTTIELMRKYYQTVEQCRSDGIKTLLEPKTHYLLKVLTLGENISTAEQDKITLLENRRPNPRIKLKNGIDFTFCSNNPKLQDFGNLPVGGFFDPIDLKITICCDRMSGRSQIQETVKHEMIHVYDMARFGDLSNCNVRACTEIRAYDLGGTCDDRLILSKFHSKEECVKAHALMSIVPLCGVLQGRQSIEQLFHQCYRDKSPFNQYNR